MESPTETESLVVYIGRLNEAKGLPLLMEAWDRADLNGMKLVIAGGGPLEDEIAAWAESRPSVEAPGLLSRQECITLLGRARAAIVPSQWQEPFGLVVAEAMSASVPSIAPSHGSFPELAALAKLLSDVENDPERWAELGRNAHATYARRFEPDGNVRQLESIYRFAVEHPIWIELDQSVTAQTNGKAPSTNGKAPSVNGTALSVKGAAVNGKKRTATVRSAMRSRIVNPDGVPEADIAGFWESHPCGDEMIGGLVERYGADFAEFFEAYDDARYKLESHIPKCLDSLGVKGKRVLEIGLGQGAESEQLSRRGARWTGLDLTSESVRRVQVRLALRDLPYEGLLRGSATHIPAADSSFDVVFSHGVLHHVPDILAAQKEVNRILRPNGRLVVMLYARGSLNYQLTIKVLRRAGLLAAWPLHGKVQRGYLGGHLRNAEREGLASYLRIDRFLHANTDGPANPYARVYGETDINRDFPDFEIAKMQKEFMHAPPLPVHGLPGGRLMGWHLWVEMKPIRKPAESESAGDEARGIRVH
jgi:ubiquinone/menaquinone biosynthesis C-methylase UbiE